MFFRGFYFGPGLSLSRSKYGVKYRPKHIYSARYQKHPLPLFSALKATFVFNKDLTQVDKWSWSTNFVLDDDTGQHWAHDAGYSRKRVGDSQDNAGVLGRYVQRINTGNQDGGKFVIKNEIIFSLHELLCTVYLNPDQAKAPRPTANVKQIMEPASVVEFAAKYMKMVWLTKAPQLNSFLTYT